jgi:PAS domain S-box-containing protein
LLPAQAGNAQPTRTDFMKAPQLESGVPVEEQFFPGEGDLLQTLIDNLPDYIYVKDSQSRLVRVNRTFARLYGLNHPSEAIGKTDANFFCPLVAKQSLLDEQKFLAGQTPVVKKLEEIQVASGAVVWVSTTKVRISASDGRAAGFIGISHDITDQQHTQATLRRTSHLLDTLLENSPDRIYFKDQQSRFVRCSAGFISLFNISDLSCLIGRTDFDFFTEAHARQAYEDEQEIIRTGKSIIGKLEKEIHSDGRVTWALTNKMPWREENGRIIGTFGISKDVTALKDAEHDRQAMEVELRQAQKLESIGRLAAGIAHEINTPTQYVGDNTNFLKDSYQTIAGVLRSHEKLLRAIKENALTPEIVAEAEQLMAAGDLNYLHAQIPAAIEETLEGVGRISKIVRAMKEFSHPGGKEKAAADLNKAIESTVTVARNEWKYVSEMKLDLDSALPPVPCFIDEFNQCILNLVTNAADAIGDVHKQKPGGKGTITVQTKRIGNEVEIRVSDTGTGIPESARAHIFEPFFTTKGVGKGTGQGLSIVFNTIVKKHGGSVKFESEAGRGTTFILRLPITAPAAVAKNGKTENDAPEKISLPAEP